MYVAQRELKHCPIGTDKVFLFKPGDKIPDFEKWPEHAKRSLINLEWVVKTKDLSKPIDPPIKGISKEPAPHKVQALPKLPIRRTEPKKPDLIRCHLCPKEFKTPKALKTHATLAHR